MDPWGFSTEALPSRDQAAAWSEWFQPIFDVHPEETEQPGFKAEYSIWKIGDVSLTWNSAPASRTVRTPWHLRHSPVDHWVITYSREGATRLSTKKAQFEAPAGQPFVWSLGQASDSRRTAAERLQLYLPRDSFARIGASLDGATGMTLRSPLGDLLADYICLLRRDLTKLAPEEAGRLRESVEAMVAACLAPSGECLASASPQIELTLMERVRRAVRRNLYSPSLGPEKLCRASALSRSKLYRLLEGEGGVVNYIQRCRLSESFTILCDPLNNTVISNIAESLCFTSASAFSRAFRQEFDMSPSDVRAAAHAGLRPEAPTMRAPDSFARTFGDCLRA